MLFFLYSKRLRSNFKTSSEILFGPLTVQWGSYQNRGEFTNVEQSIFNTESNGYIRPLNTINLNYQKSPTERKKFRHYSNNLILRRNVSGNRKMLLRLNNTKLLLSQR